MILTIDDLYNLYYGGQYVVGNARYLRKTFSEDDEEYKKRLLWSTYVNYQRKIVNTYLSYIFYGKIIVEPAQPLDLESIARKLALHSLIGGVAYLFEADQKIEVFDARQVSCRENGIYAIRGKFGDTVIDTVNMTVTGKDSTGNTVTDELAPGRFVVCKWNEDGSSLIEDTALMNLKLYNMASQLDMHYDRSLFYFLYGPSLGQDNRLVPGQYVSVAQGEQQPGIVQVDSAAAERMRKEMELVKMEMAVTVALEEEFSDEVKVESGVALAVKKLDINAIINSVAFSLTKAINEAAEHYARQYKEPLQSLKLDPLLKITTPEEEYGKYKFLLEYAGTDEVVKQVQKNIVMHCLAGEVKPEVLDSLLQSIDRDGGAKLFQSQGFLQMS